MAKKNRVITVLVSDDEKRQIIKASITAGLQVSSFMRNLAMEYINKKEGTVK
jgi:uncharacterized protein (DUF1778 family)